MQQVETGLFFVPPGDGFRGGLQKIGFITAFCTQHCLFVRTKDAGGITYAQNAEFFFRHICFVQQMLGFSEAGF